ncbi:ABC transporter ATP-binding protein [Mycoplasma sp. P36-A1]|uniref:ABC transporter ATP-binding protein n=1 Tax=Mycoplasma sp. P36-A1 TaxID=3252900 RepID=UPI003C2C0624
MKTNKTKDNQSLSVGISFLWRYIKKYRVSLVFVVAFIIFSTWLQVKAPLIMGDAINDLAAYIQAYMTPNGDTLETHTSFVNTVFKLGGAYLLVSLSMFTYQMIMSRVASGTSSRIRNALFNKLQKLSIRFFDQSNEGDILSRFTNDVDNINMLLTQSLVQIISSIALLVSISYTMFKEEASLGTIVVGLALIAGVFVLLLTRQAKKYVGVQQAKLGALNGYIDEKISGQKLIITTGTEKDTYEGFVPFNEDYRDVSKKGQAFSNVLFPMVQGFSMIAIGSIIYFGAQSVIDGTVTVGLLVAFIQYTQRFFQPLTQIVSQYNTSRLAVTGAGRAQEILDVPEEVVNIKDAIKIKKISENIIFKDVDFGYLENKPVLKNVNLVVENGHKVALVGPTGSGKTTIINLLNRFYDTTSGEIFIDNYEIKDLELGSLRRKIGNVLQDTVLFSGTIKDNIGYGKPEATIDEVQDAAKAAEIHDYIVSLPDGYNTVVDDSNSIFSVGQKQLISIARTLIVNPDLIILDEATSNVDTVTEQKIQRAMDKVLKGRTSFVIAHRLKTILDADKIVVLRDGEVIEQGTNEELLKANGFYAELYKNQFVDALD